MLHAANSARCLTFTTTLQYYICCKICFWWGQVMWMLLKSKITWKIKKFKYKTLNILPLCSPAQLAYRINVLKIHTFCLHGLKWASVLLFCPLRILNGRKSYTCMKKLSMARIILWKEAARVHVVKPSVLQQGSYKQPFP